MPPPVRSHVGHCRKKGDGRRYPGRDGVPTWGASADTCYPASVSGGAMQWDKSSGVRSREALAATALLFRMVRAGYQEPRQSHRRPLDGAAPAVPGRGGAEAHSYLRS